MNSYILSVVEIVRIHTNPKRKRGNGLATSLALRVSVSRNRGQYMYIPFHPCTHGHFPF